MTTTRVLAATAATAMLLTLTGCGSSASTPAPTKTTDDSSLSESTITLTDGREVTCVVYSAIKQGGLSCDWVGAATPAATPEVTP